MNLEIANQENLNHLVETIKSQLNIVNAALIRPENYAITAYQDLLELYRYMQKKQGNLSMMEIEGILDELRGLRIKK